MPESRSRWPGVAHHTLSTVLAAVLAHATIVRAAAGPLSPSSDGTAISFGTAQVSGLTGRCAAELAEGS